MSLFDTTNQAFQNLAASRARKRQLDLEEKQLAAQERQNGAQNFLNGLNTVAGIAKSGFDVYDKLALEPKRAELEFNRKRDLLGSEFANNKEIEVLRQSGEDKRNAASLQNSKDIETSRQASAKELQESAQKHDMWAKNLDADTAKAISEAGINRDMWMAVYNKTRDMEEGERQRAATKLLTEMGIEANRAEAAVERLWKSAEASLDRSHDMTMADKSFEQSKEMEGLRAKYGIEYLMKEDELQTIRDSVLQQNQIELASFDRGTQLLIANKQAQSQAALNKASYEYEMALEEYRQGKMSERDLAAYNNQVNIAIMNHNNTLEALGVEYGYKDTMQDKEFSARVNEIKERGAIEDAIQGKRNSTDITIAREKNATDMADLADRYSNKKELTSLYLTPDQAVTSQKADVASFYADMGKSADSLAIAREAAKKIGSDLAYFEKAPNMKEFAAIARQAYAQINGEIAALEPKKPDPKASTPSVATNLQMSTGNMNKTGIAGSWRTKR